MRTGSFFRSKGLLFAATGFGILALLFFVFRNSVDSSSEKHFIISISAPLDQSQYPAFQNIPVNSAIGSEFPITRLELWVNGKLVESHVPESARTSMYYFWDWTPEYIGEHTLFVRAYNYLGGSAESNVVHVVGIRPAGFNYLISVDGGQTLSSLAEDYEVSPAEIATENPDLQVGVNDAIPAGQLVLVPQNPWAGIDAQAPNTGGSETLTLPDGTTPAQVLPNEQRSRDWVPSFGNSPLPEAPELQVDVANCQTRLLITDSSVSEGGFYIYRLNPGTGEFVRVATLASRDLAGTMLYQEISMPGNNQYYVSAFNSGGETASNIASVEPPADCLGDGQITALRDLLDIPTGDAEEIYFYYSLNGGEWHRYPGNEQVFLNPDSLVDMGVLSADSSNAGSNLILGEAWAWDADELQFLGLFGKDNVVPPDYASAVTPSMGLLPATALEVRSEFYKEDQDLVDEGLAPISLCDSESMSQFGTGICNSREWDTFQVFSKLSETTFRWTAGAHVNMGIWQISLNPFPENQQLDPPGVILTGQTYGRGFAGLVPGEQGVFTIDLSQVTLDKLVEASQQASIEDNQQAFDPYTPPWQSGGMVGAIPGLNLGNQGVEVLPAESPNYNNTVYGEGLRRVYVRIIPMNDGQPAGLPSNTTTVYWNPDKYIPPGDEIDYQVRITDFTQTKIADPRYVHCIQIVDIDFGTVLSHAPISAQYWRHAAESDPPIAVCPARQKSESKDLLDYATEGVGYAEDAWNKIAEIYNYVNEKFDEWAVKLNPLCIQGDFAEKLIDEDGQRVQDACKEGTSIARKAALASVGLPPSLPNSEELKNMGMDYAIDMAAEEIGVECDEECKAFIKEHVGESFNAFINQSTSTTCLNSYAAQKQGFEPLCLPPGLTWVPYHEGVTHPAVAVVEVTRPLTPPDGTLPPGDSARGCMLEVELRPVENRFWDGLVYPKPAVISSNVNKAGDWIGRVLTRDDVRWLHEPQAIPTPRLAPGESMQIPVVLNRSPFEYELPGTSIYESPDDYLIAMHGMTYELEASCGEYSDTMGPDEIPMSRVPAFDLSTFQEMQQ